MFSSKVRWQTCNNNEILLFLFLPLLLSQLRHSPTYTSFITETKPKLRTKHSWGCERGVAMAIAVPNVLSRPELMMHTRQWSSWPWSTVAFYPRESHRESYVYVGKERRFGIGDKRLRRLVGKLEWEWMKEWIDVMPFPLFRFESLLSTSYIFFNFFLMLWELFSFSFRQLIV